MDEVSRPASLNTLLAGAERLVERLAEAAETGDWSTAGELDDSLALALRTLSITLGVADTAERQQAAHRLRTVQGRHAVATRALRTAHESVRAELASVTNGRRGINSYLDSAAG